MPIIHDMFWPGKFPYLETYYVSEPGGPRSGSYEMQTSMFDLYKQFAKVSDKVAYLNTFRGRSFCRWGVSGPRVEYLYFKPSMRSLVWARRGSPAWMDAYGPSLSWSEWSGIVCSNYIVKGVDSTLRLANGTVRLAGTVAELSMRLSQVAGSQMLNGLYVVCRASCGRGIPGIMARPWESSEPIADIIDATVCEPSFWWLFFFCLWATHAWSKDPNECEDPTWTNSTRDFNTSCEPEHERDLDEVIIELVVFIIPIVIDTFFFPTTPIFWLL